MSEVIGSTSLITPPSQTVTVKNSASETGEKSTSPTRYYSPDTSTRTISSGTATSLLSLDLLLASLEEDAVLAPDQTGEDRPSPPEEGEDGALRDKKGEGSGEEVKDPALLSETDLALIRQLSLQDTKVRLNEEAHVRVGGQYASSPSYDFETGPDNRQYAISGEVAFNDTPIAGNPEATIRKLSIVKKAALAPSEPSTQDRAVANKASQGITQAQARLRTEQLREQAERAAEQADAELEQSRAESRARNEALTAPVQGEQSNGADRPVPSTTAVQFAGPTPYDDGSVTPRSTAQAFKAATQLEEAPTQVPVITEIT